MTVLEAKLGSIDDFDEKVSQTPDIPTTQNFNNDLDKDGMPPASVPPAHTPEDTTDAPDVTNENQTSVSKHPNYKKSC